MSSTTNDDPERNDRSKHDEDVYEKLFLLRMIDRFSRHLCITCGERPAPLAICEHCKEAKRQKRISEAGYDYYEDFEEE